MWETDSLPRHWVALLDLADLLVVPCSFNAEVIAASRVRTPVAVVPHAAPQQLPDGISTDHLSIPQDTFVFYTIAMWTERKAVYKTVEAFLRAFTARDGVTLVIKTSQRDYTRELSQRRGLAREGTTAHSLARLLAGHEDPPSVKLITRDLTDTELAALHVRGDCYVSLCHSEGWGLGAFDAAAYGKPVVTTRYGGHLDYLAGSPYLVDYELVRVVDRAGVMSYSRDQRWAEPDVEHGAALLREVVAERERARALASERAQVIASRYSPDAVAASFIEAVDEGLRRARSSEGQAATA